MEKLLGVVNRFVFRNGENFFGVASVTAAGKDVMRGAVRVTGKLVAISEGDTVEFSGEWIRSPKYGEQFKVREARTVTPSDAAGIVAWLSSLPNLGHARAAKLVEHIGAESVWSVIEHDSDRLTEVSGITPARAEEIRAAYAERIGERDRMVFLKRWGLTDLQCAKLIKQYGDRTESVLRERPYAMTDVDGFGFVTVDTIALRLGVPRDSVERAKAALRHMLADARDSGGHTYFPRKPLIARTARQLSIPISSLCKALDALVRDDDIVIDGDGDGAAVCLRAVRWCEQRIAARFEQMVAGGGE